MRKSRFTEEQIMTILKEWEMGTESRDLCRRHGFSHASLSRWKVKFGRRSGSVTKEQVVVPPGGQESWLLRKSAGRKLRRLREDLGLSLTQVRRESEWIAKRFHNRNLVIWHGTLSTIEAGTHIPTIYQLYALSLAYRCSVSHILSFYGMG